MKPISRWQYWAQLVFLTVFSLLLTFAGMLIWLSYRETMTYIHPRRQIASGALLQARGIPFQEIQFITEDKLKLSAWYTPPQNGTVILVAHGYGDTRAEHFHSCRTLQKLWAPFHL